MKTIVQLVLLIRLGTGCLAAREPDLDPLPVGISGHIESVIVQGQYAYCELRLGSGLRIFDVSTPTNPVPLAFYEAHGEVAGLAVAGSHAYLGVGGSLHIIDISQPVNPMLVGRYDGSYGILRVAVAGNYAYLAGIVLQIVDVSDPANPRLTGTYRDFAPNPTISDVFIAGHYAYVASYGTGLDVVDVSSPASPQLVGRYPVYAASHVFVFGQHAYVGSGQIQGSWQILDISNPATPRFVRYTPIRRFVASGAYGYTGDFGGLGVLDLSDHGNPRLIGHYREFGGVSCVSGGYGYVGAGPGLQVVDLRHFSPPPEWVGRYERADEPAFELAAFVVGNIAYRGGIASQLDVIDVSNPANPRRLGQTAAMHTIYRIFVSGHHAYLATRSGISVVDVSDAANPRRVGDYAIPDGGASDVFVSGNYAFVAGSTGFQVLDVSGPANPQKVWEDPNLGALRVIVSSNYAYAVSASSGTKGLHVFDVSDPANPQSVGSYVARFDPADLFVDGDRAWLTGYGYGMEILDIGDPANPRKLGHMPVYAGRVFVSGNRAYIMEDTLRVVDVSDPANPLLMGIYDALGPVAGVSGSYAFVPYQYGLQILDLSVPPHRQKVPAGEYAPAYTGGGANVVISGNRAYASDWFGRLDVVDISNPTSLRRVASYNFGNYVVRWISGDHAFMGGETGVLILDVSDSTRLHPVGQIRTDSVIRGLAVSGNYAHIVTEEDGIHLFDVSNPASPHPVTRYSTNVRIWGLFLSGDFSCVWSESGAEIFDVSNPAGPQRLSSLSTNPFINGVSVFGDLAYVCASDGLEIFEVSNPASPRLIGSHAGAFHDFIVSGDRAYATATGIFDVSDPTRPRKVGLGIGPVQGFAGNYAFVGPPGISVVDVNHPANPQRTGAFGGVGDAAQRGAVSISGSHAFMADGTTGLQVIDVSDPVTPQRMGGYNTPGSAEDVCVAGNYAYVADWNHGLQVLNVSNPASPQFVANLALPDHEAGIPEVAERVAVSGNYAFVTGYALHVIDVSNPAQPVRVGGYAPPGGNLGIFVDGQFAYLVGAGRLHVIDVSNPASPQLAGSWVGNYLIPPDFLDVDVSAGFAYVAAGSVGMLVFDVRNPASPRFFGSYPGGDPRSVQVVGRHAYVMDRMSGLSVLDVSRPIEPRRVGGNPLIGQLSAVASDLTVVGDKVYALAGEAGLVILNQFHDPGVLRIEIPRPQTSGSFRFLLHGPAGMTGRIQSSINLQSWEDWMPFHISAGPLEVTDPAAGSRTSRFYRAISP